jgi:hypothetical protein
VSASRLDALWGVRLRVETSPAFAGCSTAAVRIGAIEGGVMFANGRWTAGWFTSGIRTREGIRIGSTVTDLRAAYGRSLFREHSLYVAHMWIYYVRRAQRPHWRLRFDVSPAGRVQSIGFGATPDVQTQEGCA